MPEYEYEHAVWIQYTGLLPGSPETILQRADTHLAV